MDLYGEKFAVKKALLLMIDLSLGLHMGKRKKCDRATLKVVEIQCGLL